MKAIKSIVLSILFATATLFATAQVKQATIKAPHNGVIQNAGDYKIEMVETDSKILFYVLDNKGKTVSNKNVSGTAVFDFFNKTTATNPISLEAKNALAVEVPKANVYTYCTISAVVKGKTITAKFRNSKVSESDIHHGHQH